jgi:hypothetical protein
MGRHLERYLAGECQPVWDELLAQGAAIREEPLASEALAVARETMRRVRHNIELLIPRLRTLGYRFGKAQRVSNQMVIVDPARLDEFIEDYLAEYPIFQPPPPDTARTLDELEQRVGLLPLSLRAFYLEIGGVNFTGLHPWVPRALDYDPLFIFPLADLLEDVEAWSLNEDSSEPEEARDTDLWLSPDAPHKFNESGADPYFMRVPNASIDGIFHDGYHDVTFVEYLRLGFRSGGLTDLEQEEQLMKDVGEALAYLRQDLLPI